MVRRLLLALPVLLALAGGLAACSSDEERLTIYSGRNSELLGPLLEQFSEETGIGIDVRYGQSADLALLIGEEGDRSPADVFISQSPGAEGYLDEQGLLAELPASVLDLVPEASRAADGSWVGLSARFRTLVYDSDTVDEADLPESVLDLVDPQYEGQVAVAPENGSFQDFVTSMRTEIGDDETEAWLTGMAENNSPVYADNLSIVDAVARGRRALRAGEPLLQLPDPGGGPRRAEPEPLLLGRRPGLAPPGDRRQHPRVRRPARRGGRADRVPARRGRPDLLHRRDLRVPPGRRASSRPTSSPTRPRSATSTSTSCPAASSAPRS